MVLADLIRRQRVLGDVERRLGIDSRDHVARKQAVVLAELVVDAQRHLELRLMYGSAVLNEAARIVGLRQVRGDLDRRRAHGERSREMAEHGAGEAATAAADGQFAAMYCEKSPRNSAAVGTYATLINQILADRRSLVTGEEEQLVLNQASAHRSAELVPFQAVASRWRRNRANSALRCGRTRTSRHGMHCCRT